jgi:hypothetical protein
VDIFLWAIGVRHNGLGVGRPVVEAVQHPIQTRMAAVFQKPFDVGPVTWIES